MNRLRSQQDFQRVRRGGRVWAHPLVVLNACRNDLESSRYGIVVGKGVGKAVVRNRAKRLLREALRSRSADIQAGWDIVLVARQAMRGSRLQHVQSAVDEVLSRARIVRSVEE